MTQHSQPQDLNKLSTQFRSAIEDLTHEWGFVVVRTAYAADKDHDEAQWALALEKLRAYATPDDDDDVEMDPATFALPVIADSTLLRGADQATVRKAFNGWIDDFVCHRKRKPVENDPNEEWPSDICRNACIVIDSHSLASLLKAPDLLRSNISCNPNLEPWILIIDAKDPNSVPYGGGGPYMGFTRARARVLHQLYEDLGARSLARLSPVRAYQGQIPLYDGSLRGKLVDPEGGVEERYKFPQGTPRGVDGARAMLEEIERAVGRVNGLGN
ncbi:hypothetical protein GMOD_00004369 [Pyrenophora seminiperda CCB06]|uniref:Uncharacterized protein n=1 Tax=Pyrenophora seminiperda CCB06 TaxID=1302712 RepID=A0A3M7M0Y4_9PLEO|nr:hypothetical protein GMOD_00004369 [Pyrenophora seminiperda CCB06]